MAHWRRWLSLVAQALALVGLAAAGYAGTARLLPTLYQARAPVRPPTVDAGAAVAPERRVVVLAVADLSDDWLARMPTLRMLRYQGAHGNVLPDAYASTRSLWTTLVSGAGPELTGAALVADWPPSPPADDIMASARRAGLTVTVCGHGAEPRTDEQVVDDALRALAGEPPALLWVELAGLSLAAPPDAPDAAIATVAQRVDTQVSALLDAIDLRETCLVVASHSTPAAAEPRGRLAVDTVLAPLILTGAGIRPGPLGAVELTAVAPTIAALLGIAPPALAEGDALWSALAQDEAQSAAAQVRQARQRVALAEACVEQYGAGAPDPHMAQDVSVGEQSLAAGNLRGAAQLAQFALSSSREALATAAQARLATERLHRAPLALLLALLPVTLWAIRRVHLRWRLLACAATVPLLYYALYRWLGYGRDLSAIADLRTYVRDAVRHLALAVGPGSLAAVAVCLADYRRSRRRSLPALGSGLLTFGLQVCYLIALPAIACFAAHGLAVTWHVPDPRLLCVQIASLLHTFLAAVVFVVLPWPVLLLALPAELRERQRATARLNLVEEPHAHRRHRQ